MKKAKLEFLLNYLRDEVELTADNIVRMAAIDRFFDSEILLNSEKTYELMTEKFAKSPYAIDEMSVMTFGELMDTIAVMKPLQEQKTAWQMAILLIAENFNKRTFFRRDESVSFSDVTSILKALPQQPGDEFAKDDWYHIT